MIQKSLQEHHLQKQKHLTGGSGSSEQHGALTEDWVLSVILGYQNKKEM